MAQELSHYERTALLDFKRDTNKMYYT